MNQGFNEKQAVDSSSVLLGLLNDKPSPPSSKNDSSKTLLSLLNQPLTPSQDSDSELPKSSGSKPQAKVLGESEIKALLFPAVTPYSESQNSKKPKTPTKTPKKVTREIDPIAMSSEIGVSGSYKINERNTHGTKFTHVSPFDQIPLDSDSGPAKPAPKGYEYKEDLSRSPGFRISGKFLNLSSKAFSVAAPLSSVFNEMKIVRVPHETSPEAKKTIVARQGFAGYSVKGGRIRVLKEISGTMELLKEHKALVVDMKFWDPENAQELDNEERYLISISLDSTLLLWSFKNAAFSSKAISYTVEFGLQGTPSQGSSHRYQLLAWNPANMDIIAVATDSNTVLLIDISTYMKPSGSPPSLESELGNMITEVKVGQPITSLAFSPDGRQLAVGEASGKVLLMELEDADVCEKKHLSTPANSAISFLSFVKREGGAALLMGSDNNSEIRLQDLSSDSVAQTIRLQSPSGLNGICFEKNSNILFLSCQKRKSLLAFHVSLEPSPNFDFVSEYSVSEPILDFEATRDVLTYKCPPSERSISLFVSQSESKSMFVIPASSLYPEDLKSYPLLSGSCKEQQGPLSVPSADATLLTELFTLNASSNPKPAPKPSPLVQEDGSLSLTSLFLANETLNATQPRVPSPDQFPSLSQKSNSTIALTPNKPTLAQVVARNSEDVGSVVKREVSGAAKQTSKDVAKLGVQLNSISTDLKALPGSLNQSLATSLNTTLKACAQEQFSQILDERFSSAFKQFLNGKEFRSLLDSQLKKHTTEALASSNITSAIGEAVSDLVAKSAQKAVAQQIESVLIPAYEAASASMFQQMHKAFTEGLKKINESHEALLALQQAQLTKVAELLASQESPSIPTPKSRPQKPEPQIQKSEPQKTESQKPEPINPQPKAAVSSPTPAAKVATPPSFGVEESILEALATSDHKRLVLLFHEATPAAVFKYCDLPQKNMLILAKLMTKELGTQTHLKLTIIKECLNRLSPKDNSISEHIGRFLATIKSSLNNFTAKLTTSDSDQQTVADIRLLMSSCSSLLAPK